MTSEEKLTKAVTPAVIEELYNQKIAPFLNGSGATHYSTEEQVVGTWMGEPLYQKTINFGALPNNTQKSINHGISNIAKIVSNTGYATTNSTDYFIPIPWNPANFDAEQSVALFSSKSEILIKVSYDLSMYTECYVTLQYTKTS